MDLVLSMLITLCTPVCLVDGMKECPPWFEWVNTSDSSGYCACPSQVQNFIHCDERNLRSSISQGSCISYEHKEDITRGSWCSFPFPTHATRNGMFILPANVVSYSSCWRCHNSEIQRLLYEGATSPPKYFTVDKVHWSFLHENLCRISDMGMNVNFWWANASEIWSATLFILFSCRCIIVKLCRYVGGKIQKRKALKCKWTCEASNCIVNIVFGL